MTENNKNSVQAVESYYDDVTGKYLEIYGEVIQAYRPANTTELLKYTIKSAGLEDGQYLIDAGCGVGGPAIFFAKELNIKIDGVTISQVQVEVAREKIRQNRLEAKVQIQKGDYHHLDKIYPAEVADGVLFLEALGHAERPVQVIQAAHKVLKEGGFIYIKDFFQREIAEAARAQRTQRVIENIDKAYNYNTLELHEILSALRKTGFHIEFIKKPTFENDIRIRSAFETALEIDLYDGEQEFVPAEWLEIKCRKYWW